MYFYFTTEVEECKNIIEMYHSETSCEKKDVIVQKLGKDSYLRNVVATSALGMGIDVNDCNFVWSTLGNCRLVVGKLVDVVKMVKSLFQSSCATVTNLTFKFTGDKM